MLETITGAVLEERWRGEITVVIWRRGEQRQRKNYRDQHRLGEGSTGRRVKGEQNKRTDDLKKVEAKKHQGKRGEESENRNKGERVR